LRLHRRILTVKLLVISGGRHPYNESTPVLEGFLRAAGHDATITEDASILGRVSDMSAFDALVFNTRREDVPDFGNSTLTAEEQNGMKQFISSGKGFVCIHIATCVPQGWEEYLDITGGGWVSGASFHPPYGQFEVNVTNAGHPGVSGVADFSTNDELYMGLTMRDGNDVFITGTSVEGTWPWGPDRAPKHMASGTFPLGWTRHYGDGRVYVLLLGHDGQSFETPGFQKLVLNGVDWVTANKAALAG
jgi:type 1 glutamine amidotransferase